MSRPFTTLERSYVGNDSHVTHILVQVEDADGAFREMTNFLGYDWFLSARWAGDADRGFETGTLTLFRYGAELNISLSPEIGGSPANRNALGGYAPLLEPGRRVKWQTCVRPKGIIPAPSEYLPQFDGYIARLGGTEEEVEIECTDRGGPLMRVQINAKTRYGAPGAGQLLEIGLQQMINDWADAPPALDVPNPVGRVVGEWDQDVGSLLEGLRAVASQGGQDIRYRWGADNVSRLTYWTPNRADIATQPVVDWLDPDEYWKANPIEKDIATIRNDAIVRFVKADGSAGMQRFEDPVSRGKYGRQTAEVQRDKTSTIRTDGEALTLATTVVHDLAVPIADHKIESPFYPWVEIGDVMGCRADGKYYDSDQKFAVAGYEHRIQDGEGFTDFLVRGRVSGQYRLWIRAGGGGIGGRIGIPISDPIVSEQTSRQNVLGVAAGVLQLTVYDPSLAIESVEFATRIGSSGAWSAWSPDAAPYSASVALVQGEASAIMYRIMGVRPDGTRGVLRSTTVEFPSTTAGNLEMRARITGWTPTTTTVTGDAVAPAGAPAPQVMLVAITGSAALVSGPAIGVLAPSGTQWVFSHGAPGTGIGQAQFRTVLAGYQSDDDFAVIDDQGLVPLSVRAQPVTPTATTVPVDLVVDDPSGDAGAVTVTLTFTGMATVDVAGVLRSSGYVFAMAPGSVVRITSTKPAFGNPSARLLIVAAKTGRTQDSDAVDVAPQDRDTIYPVGNATVAENGLYAITTLSVNDPQSRRTSVDFAYGFGNTPLVAPVVVSPDVFGRYVFYAPLREKQPTRIEWRIWGTAADGSTQVLDSGQIRSAIGAKPLLPDIRPEVSQTGRLSAIIRGDSDTTEIRVFVKLDSEPTIGEIDTLGQAFAGRTAPFLYDTPLSPGSRYYIGARAYNSATPDPINGALPGYASDPAILSDVWTGLSGNRATVKVARAVATESSVTFEGIEFGPMAALVEVYAVEYRGDPGAVSSVFGVGYRPPGAPVRVSGSAITVPISIPGNYVAVSFAAVDINNRVGVDNTSVVDQFAGIVTLKVQSAGAVSARPPAPQDLAVSSIGVANNAINLDVTLPAVLGSATKLRIFRDGTAYGADVAITGAGGAVQRVTVPATPSTTYTHQVYTIDAAGIISAIGTPARTITLGIGQVPKPTVAVGAFSLETWGVPVTITPAAGTPSGVTWHVLTFATEIEAGYSEKSTRTVLTFNQQIDLVPTPEPTHGQIFVKVWGEAVGYSNSPESDPVHWDY